MGNCLSIRSIFSSSSSPPSYPTSSSSSAPPPPPPASYTSHVPHVSYSSIPADDASTVRLRQEYDHGLTTLRRHVIDEPQLTSLSCPHLTYSTWLHLLTSHYYHSIQQSYNQGQAAHLFNTVGGAWAPRTLHSNVHPYLQSLHANQHVVTQIQQEPMVVDLHVSLLVLSLTHRGIGAARVEEVCDAEGAQLFTSVDELLRVVDLLHPSRPCTHTPQSPSCRVRSMAWTRD